MVTTTPTYIFQKIKGAKNSLKNRCQRKERETNEKFLNNLSSHQLTDSLLSGGLKFIPTPATNETSIKGYFPPSETTFQKSVILSSVSKKKIKNLKKRPSYLEKTYFQIKFINCEGVINLSTDETPGEIFAANAHRSYFMSFAYFLFTSCI